MVFNKAIISIIIMIRGSEVRCIIPEAGRGSFCCLTGAGELTPVTEQSVKPPHKKKREFLSHVINSLIDTWFSGVSNVNDHI